MDRTITVRLPEEKVLRLQRLAEQEQKTMTDVIEESVDQRLANAPEEDNVSALSYVIGRCSSGGTKLDELDFAKFLQEDVRSGRL